MAAGGRVSNVAFAGSGYLKHTWRPMTPEQALKIVNWLELRSAPKPKQEQKASLAKDLLQHDYQKTVDKCKEYVLHSNWWPVISQISPPPELQAYKPPFKTGIKGKDGVNLIKKAIERAKHETMQ